MTTDHSAATFIGTGSYINTKYGADSVQVKLPAEAIVSFDNCISAAKLTGVSNVRGFIGNKSGENNYTGARSNGSKFVGSIYTMSKASDSAYIIHGSLNNTALDSYVVHCAGTAEDGVGYIARQDIVKGTLTYEAGAFLTVPKQANAVSYIFAYSFARGGSTYGNSATLVSPTGATVSSPEGIRFFDKIYDVAGEAYTDAQKNDLNALCVYGPLNTNIPDVDTMKVTFSVMALDEAGNVVYYASCTTDGKDGNPSPIPYNPAPAAE